DIVFIANDGGLWRLNGSFSDVSSQCGSRGLTGADLTDCQNWLSKVPTTIATMNQGLGTLQYQSLSINVQNPLNDIMGGTQDNGGNQAFLEAHCAEFPLLPGGFSKGDLIFTGACGDWEAIGKDLSGTSFGKDKAPGQYIVATERAPSDNSTLWAGLRRGRVFISSNADKAGGQVVFFRIDTSSTPTRFVSGIAVDPSDPNHAFISFSGYNAYNPTQPGHVFDVHYDSTGHTATWTNIDHNLGDEPITDIALDPNTGDLYVSTDF